MRATFGGALLALAAIALSGCTGAGVQPVTGAPAASTPTTTISLATPTSAGSAADMVNRRSEELIETMERFKDQGCAYGRKGTTCSLDRSRIHRMSTIMRVELDNSAPWAAGVEALAKRTSSRLAAVSSMTQDPGGGGALLDTEMTALIQDLTSWSSVSD